jgi:hypothetical protein
MRRAKLKSLKQQHDYSCGQTCVAMLTGASYKAVIKFMGSASTDTSKIRRGLNRFKVKSATRLKQFRGNEQYPNYKKLDFDAVLKMKHRGRSMYHWIVWDSKRGKCLDPQNPSFKIGPAHRITSYLRTWHSSQSK